MNRLEIDTKGFAELQAGRPKWSFVRELVSNAWDEDVTFCKVDVIKNGNRAAVITVEDDGAGFRDIRDAYTLYGHTPKRADPTVRGRFNLGEKELAAIALSMRIETTCGGIEFPRGGGRRRLTRRRENGTLVTTEVTWTKAEVKEVVEMLRLFMPPPGKRLIVNDETYSSPSEPIGAQKVALNTVIESDGVLKESYRMTDVVIHHKPHWTETGWLYELGIPVQPLACRYSADVQQKVPMPPNRDTVGDCYLRDIYAVILNNVAEGLDPDDCSEAWIRLAMESSDLVSGSVLAVSRKRYGEKVAIWSPDSEANERAIGAGFMLVHPRTLSASEKSRFKEAGIVSAHENFGAIPKAVDYIPFDDWTEDMMMLANYAIFLSNELQRKRLNVRFFRDYEISGLANFCDGTITFNLAKITLDPIIPGLTGLILHELAHRKGEGHFDIKYINELDRLAGEAVHLALDKPDGFLIKS